MYLHCLVKSKLQPPPLFPPPPQGIPQAFDTFAVPGGGNLIISQPLIELLASQLHVNNQSVSLSVKKPLKQLT